MGTACRSDSIEIINKSVFDFWKISLSISIKKKTFVNQLEPTPESNDGSFIFIAGQKERESILGEYRKVMHTIHNNNREQKTEKKGNPRTNQKKRRKIGLFMKISNKRLTISTDIQNIKKKREKRNGNEYRIKMLLKEALDQMKLAQNTQQRQLQVKFSRCVLFLLSPRRTILFSLSTTRLFLELCSVLLCVSVSFNLFYLHASHPYHPSST